MLVERRVPGFFLAAFLFSSLLSLKHAGIGASHRDASGGAGNVETFVRIYHLFRSFFPVSPRLP